MSKRVLITGIAGFIGSHVADIFVEAGHEVMGVDNLSSGKSNNLSPDIQSSILFVKEDIRGSAIAIYVKRFKPDVVIHLAAQPSLLESIENPIADADMNIIGTLNMIKLAKEVGARRFIFASTSAAQRDWGPYFTDTQEEYPTSPYGISKMAAEAYLYVLGGFVGTGLSVVTLRFANIYGPRQVPLGENQLIPRALDHIYKDEFFEVHQKGEQTRDFTYVTDVVNAILLAATHRYDRGGLFNISSGKSHSVNYVLSILKKLTKFKKKWIVEDDYGHRGARWDVEMDNSLFVNEFGWQPQYTLEEGLKETVEWYKSQL